MSRSPSVFHTTCALDFTMFLYWGRSLPTVYRRSKIHSTACVKNRGASAHENTSKNKTKIVTTLSMAPTVITFFGVMRQKGERHDAVRREGGHDERKGEHHEAVPESHQTLIDNQQGNSQKVTYFRLFGVIGMMGTIWHDFMLVTLLILLSN